MSSSNVLAPASAGESGTATTPGADENKEEVSESSSAHHQEDQQQTQSSPQQSQPAEQNMDRKEQDQDTKATQQHEEEDGDDSNFGTHYLDIHPDYLNPIPEWLAPCHMIAALILAIQVIFLFVFSSFVEQKWHLYTNFPAPLSSGDQDGGGDSAIDPTKSFAIPEAECVATYTITWYAGIFTFLSVLDHLACIIPGLRQRYEYYIERNQSPYRWFEFSFSSSLMKVYVAQLAGITDIHLLICIFVLAHVTPYFGICHELANARARAEGYEQAWWPFWLGTVPHMTAWCMIGSYFFTSVHRGHEQEGFISVVCVGLFCLDGCFPIQQYLQWHRVGIFEDYVYGELGFICLSFVTKSLIAWITVTSATNLRSD